MDQRDSAAFFAIAERFFALSALALAGPPFFPPNRPRATAFWFLPSAAGSIAGFVGGSPVMAWTMEKAIVFGSGRRGFLLDRLGILEIMKKGG